MATGASGRRVRLLEERLAERSGLPAPGVWIAASTVVFAACAAWHNVTGAWSGLLANGQAFWRTTWSIEIVFALLIGFTFAAGPWLLRGARRQLDALAPALDAPPDAIAGARERLAAFPRGGLLAAGAAGVALGAALTVLVTASLAESHAATLDLSWRHVRDTVLWAIAARLVFVVLESSRTLSELSERSARIDLLDLRPLGPLARVGLRGALVFAIATSLIAAMLDDVRTVPLTLGAMSLVAGVGAVALVLPVRGVHRRIRAEKAAELTRVRAAIGRERTGALAPGAGARDAVDRLGGLLAYEHRIQTVSEWPFDLGTFVRFAVFLALPVGSWLGGAMVDWLVARVLE